MNYNELTNMLLTEAYDDKGKKKEMSSDDKDAILEYFATNKNPSDAEFHGWAESEGIDVHEAEEIAYELASRMARFVKGGKWNQTDQPDVDAKQLAIGTKVEYEHTPDADVAERIARDHLAEIDDYYTRLAKMEAAAGVDHEDEDTGEEETEDNDEE